ncbi:CU044_5270 family protein [Gryllotalpicola reticulitermitis]|uniref:CU044_5270 family protein n=1 Tax=Gryllotalpicola reticulitermitis TaxID=1184153 RepID=A0ABV8PZY0_9MICO
MTPHIDSPVLPDEAEFDRMRAEILARIDTESLEAGAHVPSRKRRRARVPRRRVGWRRAGWSAGGAVLILSVAGVLVATNVIGLPGSRVGASPAAAAVLNSAADVAVHESDPVVAPGQYLKIETTAVSTEGTPSYQTQETDVQYIPADRSKTWIWVQGATTVYKTFGPASAAAAKAKTDPDAAASWIPGVGGRYYGSPIPADDADMAPLPADPTQLLNYIYDHTRGQGDSRNGEAFVWIADRLTSGTVPASIRATMFRTAAMIPGVVVTDQTANLDGRTGVAVGYTDTTDDNRQDLIVDPSTGAFIGERDVRVAATSNLPGGSVWESTAVTTSVVDSAPHATADGGFNSTGCTANFWTETINGTVLNTGINPGSNGQPAAYECPNN